MSSQSTSSRFHSLDALRAFALLLGIVFHAALSFSNLDSVAWAIQDLSTHYIFILFIHATHSFRLELFFLMAGFFAHMLYHKRGTKGFMTNRTLRIIIPFVIGWIILFPLLIHLWTWGALKSGNFQVVDIPQEFRHFSAWQLTLGSIITLQFIENFDLAHLWFLHQLFVLYLIAVAVRWGFYKTFAHTTHWARKGDAIVQWLMHTKWNVIFLALPAIGCLLLMKELTVETPKQSLIPYLPTTLLYGYIFLLGWMLHRQYDLIEKFPRQWWWYIIAGILLTFASLAYRSTMNESNFATRFTYFSLYALMMWTYMFGLTGFFVHTFRAENRLWRYISDSSYWLYIIHLPIVVYFQIILADVNLHWSIKFPLVNLITFPILFLTYHYCVRPTFIGQILNGRKYPIRPLFSLNSVYSKSTTKS